MAQQFEVGIIVPVLVALAAVAGVEDHFLTAVVQTGVIPSDLASFAVHPELQINMKRLIQNILLQKVN